MGSGAATNTRKRSFWSVVSGQRELILMSVPLLLYKVLFSYVPIGGWTMAFQNFKPAIRTWYKQQWVGFDNFVKLFTGLNGERFIRDIGNTLAQSLLTLVLGYVCSIVLALLLNEVKNIGFKRVVQNITYMPHFLSWIIVAGLVSTALSVPTSGGIINTVLMGLHIIDTPILFLANPGYFWGIVAGSHLWKELGWNTIIYMAAITAIDPALYEASDMDGANRYQKMWNITLPCIKSTIVILLIMSIGNVLEAGFEIQYFLGNGLIVEKSETIDIFVLRYGIQMGNFSLATVAGMFKTVISILLITGANFISGKLGEEKLI
ncbi:MAG: ABC transporter permease subunit [Clostridiales bacterium]|nr:ABC transporter permease subunit [Clostridiales bacterium]MDR2750121.1 ABC transporter permease subunit [Clostridiales bacterium]